MVYLKLHPVASVDARGAKGNIGNKRVNRRQWKRYSCAVMNTQRRNQNPTKHLTVTYGTESVSFIVNSSWGNWKNWQSLIISKKSSVKKLKTNTVHAGYAKPIFNVFFMKNMCCIGIETFLLSSSICYVLDVFYFSFIFFPIESSILT